MPITCASFRVPSKLWWQTVLEALPEIEGQIYVQLLNGVYQTGEPFRGHEVPLQLLTADTLTTLYVDFVYLPPGTTTPH